MTETRKKLGGENKRPVQKTCCEDKKSQKNSDTVWTQRSKERSQS